MEAPSKYSSFTKKEVTYKTINNHAITTAIFIPKMGPSSSNKNPHPLLIHFHGGFLICGHSTYEEWHATWTIQLALQHSAILVSPNYRLLPESNGHDILSDISDFWTWVKTSLASEISSISPDTNIDLSNILVAGESAGGYLAIQSALLFPEAGIKAVISQYGMLDNRIPHFAEKGFKYMAGAPQQPESDVDEYIRDAKKGDVRTNTHPWEMWLFICATVQAGRYLDFLGQDELLHPVENLRNVARVPPCWIVHGKEDSLVSFVFSSVCWFYWLGANDTQVPIAASDNFVQKLGTTHPQTPLLYTVQPGEHGFDGKVTMDEEWVKEGCAWLKQYWP